MMGISAGNVAGAADDVTILDNGNVGIGTTDPGAKLEVSSSGSSVGQLILRDTGTSATNAGLTIRTDSTTNAESRSWFMGSNVTEYGDFQIIQSNAKAGNPISAGTARFVIENTGNVGIGTPTPGAKLSVMDTISGVTTGRKRIKTLEPSVKELSN